MRKKLLQGLGALAVVALGAGGATLAAMAWSQAKWERDGAARWPMRGERLALAGGRGLRVWCEGEGPRVVFEASGLGGADQYEKMIELLRGRTRVCAYDRAGFGYSDPRAGATTLTALADDLWAVAEHAGQDPTLILVGASYGGLVAQLAARRHAKEVSGLVLLDAVPPDAFADLAEPWRRLDASIDRAATLARLGLLRAADPLHLGDSRAAWLTYRPGTWRSVQALMGSRAGAPEELAAAGALPRDLPLRVIRHTRVGDLLGPDTSLAEHHALEPKWQALQQALAQSSTRGTLLAPENVGHLIAFDAPDLVAAQVDALLSR